MSMLRILFMLMAGAALVACNGHDAPPAPSVTPSARAAEATAPAQASAAPEVAPAPDTATAPSAPAAKVDDAAPVYQAQCASGASAAEQCQVDKDTYIGWRTFAAQCQVCHGGSALGSTFAPNLLDRFHDHVDHARFVEVVTNGFRGQVGAMPAWKGNPNVMPHLDQLYRYLKARADGALPAGRPTRLP